MNKKDENLDTTGTPPLDSAWYFKRLEQYLATRDLKQTKQRHQIVEAFVTCGGHVDAEQLHGILRDRGLNIGLATIYRTLNLLKSANLAIQHQFADGKSSFEPRVPNEHHDHLVCLTCGAIVEFQNEMIETLQQNVATQYGFRLVDHRLDLFGYCPSCSR